ncbi:hypothetical protein [Fictibacillus barbaricus]|uniref:DUF4362 domain-containing protein n=1 Tax=Fictibacillus barbaricus TaxID=182136 RepID=A0ABU1U695_9BACL|nr:hypothetical protein [Fictibacillus barbaricus]MDR7074937.1 hypothetical protein [Fictibacillus barbaricus]
MRKLWGLWIVILLFAIAACSDHESEKKPKFTVKDAISKNHVVIQNQSDNRNELLTGAVKAKNLQPMFAFLDDVNEGKESKVKITVFNKKGNSTTSELHYISKGKIEFLNNEKSYGMPTGKFECSDMRESNESVQLGGCKGDLANILAIKYTIRDHLLASIEYKKRNKQ